MVGLGPPRKVAAVDPSCGSAKLNSYVLSFFGASLGLSTPTSTLSPIHPHRLRLIGRTSESDPMLASIPSPSSPMLEVGPLMLRYYGVFVALGALVAVAIAQRRLEGARR